MVCSPWPPATRRSICSRATAAALALALLGLFDPRPVLADDRTSIDEGRVAARGILIVREPGGCGIVLLRERCIADVEAFLQRHGRNDRDYANLSKIGLRPASGLRAFVAHGDRDGFDAALSWFNNVQANELRWKADPRDAALYDAGIISVLGPTAGLDPGGAEVAIVEGRLGEALVVAGPVIDLAQHAALIPAGALPIDLAPLRSMSAELSRGRANVFRLPQMIPFARSLASAIAETAPPPPLAAVPRSDAPAADPALGLAVATMAELLQAVPWSVQHDAQAFAAALADRLEVLVPQPGRPFVASFRRKAQAGTSHDRAGASDALTAALAVFDATVRLERRQRVALGSGVAQLAYNAANTRVAESSRNLLTVLAGSDALDAAIPGWKAARADGASIGASDWLAQHVYALRLVELIQKANPT
jgi:hypothetical protein